MNCKVIVACGQQKQTVKCPASEMYIGTYHRACLAYARTLAGDDDIYILSAKYGVLRLSDEIEPYEKRLSTRKGDHTEFTDFYKLVRGQIDSLGLHQLKVVVLGGKDYSQFCDAFWQCETPLAGVGGIGKQIQWLKQNTKRNL